MLNIISRSIVSSHTRGPRKVVLNLIKGLDEIGYPYVLNADLDATNTIWIHDDKTALETALTLPDPRSIIVGPNIYTLPTEVPKHAVTKNVLFLHPALWVQDFWNTFSSQKINSAIWPAGIDTGTFSPIATEKNLVLVYNKQRSHDDVATVCSALEAQGQQFSVVTYGKYSEQEYHKLLLRAKAMIWIGRSESQGIGLLEALAMDVPILVWDITKFGDFVGAEKSDFTQQQLAFSPVTAAPYFDERCGMRFTQKEEMVPTLTTFLGLLSTFQPRNYVETELFLAKQAQAFIDLYKTHFSITETDLKDTVLRNQKKWKNAGLCFILHTRLKDAIRSIIR